MSRSQTAPARIVKATRRWIGTPYHDQASVRGVGCDCLGLLRGVWRDIVGPEPMPVPPYSRDWGEAGPVEVLAEAARAAMTELDIADARTGDVVLFRMRACAQARLPSMWGFCPARPVVCVRTGARARIAVGVPTAVRVRTGVRARTLFTPMNAPA